MDIKWRATPRCSENINHTFFQLFVHKLPPATMGFVKGGKQKQRDPYKVQGGNKKQRIDLRAAAAERAAAANAETEADDNDSNMAPSEVPSETETEDSVGKKPRARRLRDADRKALGEHVLSQEELRTYVVVAYVKRFKEPDESSWGEIAETLSKEIGLNQRTTRSVLNRCHQHHANPAKQKPGAGRPKKLEKNNKGLLAAIVALNGGVPPNIATEICNAENAGTGVIVSRNTLMATIRDYTDVEQVACLRRKTGSKNAEGDWATARLAFCEQMKEQYELGRKVDAGEIREIDCPLPPLYKDGIMFADENHI